MLDFFKNFKNSFFLIILLIITASCGGFGFFKLFLELTNNINPENWDLLSDLNISNKKIYLSNNNGIILKKKDNLTHFFSISADIRFANENYLTFLIRWSKEDYYTFRISSLKAFPTGFSKYERNLLTEFEEIDIKPPINNPFNVKIEFIDSIFKAYLNNKLILTYFDPNWFDGTVGLKGEYEKVEVSNIYVEGVKKGNLFTIKETFQSKYDTHYYCFIFIILSNFILFLTSFFSSFLISKISLISKEEIFKYEVFSYLPLILLYFSSLENYLMIISLIIISIILLKSYFFIKYRKLLNIYASKAHLDIFHSQPIKAGFKVVLKEKILLFLILIIFLSLFLFNFYNVANISYLGFLFIIIYPLYSLILRKVTLISFSKILYYDLFTYLTYPILAFIFILDLKIFKWNFNQSYYLALASILTVYLKFLYIIINLEHILYFKNIVILLFLLFFISFETLIRSTKLNIEEWKNDWDRGYPQDILKGEKLESSELEDNIYKIVWLGRSLGIEDSKNNSSSKLEKLLNFIAGERRFKVINATFPDYTSLQGLLFLKREVLKIKPSLVIFQFGYNDSLFSESNLTDKMLLNNSYSLIEDKKLAYIEKLVSKSRFLSNCYTFFRKILYNRTKRVPLEDFKENLKNFVKVCNENNIKPVFLYDITWDIYLPISNLDSYYESMKEVAYYNNILLIDSISPILKNKDNFFIDKLHLSKYGQYIIVEEIVKRLNIAFPEIYDRNCLPDYLLEREIKLISLLGEFYEKEGIYELARKSYEKLLEIDPLNEEGILKKNILYVNFLEKNEKLEEAKLYLKELIKKDKNFYQLYVKLGTILKQEGKFEEAIKMFEEALILNKNSTESILELGLIAFKINLFNEAKSLLKRATSSFQNNVEAHFALANIYKNENNDIDATYHWWKAFKIAPLSEYGKIALNYLPKIGNQNKIFTHEKDFTYSFEIPSFYSKYDDKNQGKFKLILFEDGTSCNNYTHIGNKIYFSSSDKSDPNKNGKNYFIRVALR